ncbi:MAG: hypothetical protein ACFFG0_03345 [Candidatus Thorarchaeota archaeon]
MITICAWCKKELGKKAPYKDKSITHGICNVCRKKMLENPFFKG